MRTYNFILIALLLFSCNQDNEGSTKTNIDSAAIVKLSPIDTLKKIPVPLLKPTVLVLPPYDFHAGLGISPDIRTYIENLISTDTSLKLIPFPFKKLMQEPYSNVFDKKYCQEILKVVPSDFIIMSKIDYIKRTGNMETDEFKFKVKIYNVKADTQFISKLTATSSNPTNELIKSCIAKSDLTSEIKNSH